LSCSMKLKNNIARNCCMAWIAHAVGFAGCIENFAMWSEPLPKHFNLTF
jgi:hypothetical protein